MCHFSKMNWFLWQKFRDCTPIGVRFWWKICEQEVNHEIDEVIILQNLLAKISGFKIHVPGFSETVPSQKIAHWAVFRKRFLLAAHGRLLRSMKCACMYHCALEMGMCLASGARVKRCAAGEMPKTHCLYTVEQKLISLRRLREEYGGNISLASRELDTTHSAIPGSRMYNTVYRSLFACKFTLLVRFLIKARAFIWN